MKRLCPYPCPRTVKGTLLRAARADKRYCSEACRQRAKRRRFKADQDAQERHRIRNRAYQAAKRQAAKVAA